MSGSQRRKGHNFERDTAHRWSRCFPNAHRNLDDVYGGSGVDLSETGNLKVQCKSYKNYAPINKIHEIKEAGIPVLVTKGDRLPPVVVLFESDFLDILEDIGVVYEESGYLPEDHTPHRKRGRDSER